ncbi:MAG: hypothetical protein A2W22_04110 [Candidatus Levybacteria bacterium RBG_16_35_11]|nr:MAG: hypothetical protein A2W22_04110 [Candidatus Levybacteria bacterium RBG_16_35_11]
MQIIDFNDLSNLVFYSKTYGKTNVQQMVNIIKEFIDESPSSNYKLVIGTDSHEKKCIDRKEAREISLVTAVVLHRKGFGGKYFWIKQKPKKINSLREKIKDETNASLLFALSFLPHLEKTLNGQSPKLEIHLDVGNNGETRDMIGEVVGMITGNGFEAKTKPDSYAASKVADKHT